VFRRLALIAASEAPIILVGATGTGKEQVAHAIHDLSGRRGELIAVNCGALPEALVESELFGHRKGAFTGATTEQLGLVRAAHGGTLFLDEIDDLPLRAQAALLRVLQERTVVPVGTARPIPADIRVVAATQRDLAALVAAGRFRADLFARLRGAEIGLPTLLARREDFGLLVAALLQRIAGDLAQTVEFTTAAAEALSLYDWPLNIRELEQCLTTALALAEGRPISASELPEHVRAAVDRVARPLDAIAEKLREDLVWLFREHHGNTGAVAQALGKSRRQVQRLARRYRIDLRGFRS